VGTVILAPIPYVLQELYLYKDIIYGGLIVFTTIFLPRGVYGSFLFYRRTRAAARAAASPTPGVARS
jgi:ABC-type branched-subunit amino acid transport system permease subunit